MHDIVAYLKACVDRSDNAGIYGCLIVREGCIYSRNVSMQAGLAMESAEPFNIPAAELERALGRMKSVDTLRIKDGIIRIKSGNKSVAIKVNTSEAQPMPDMPPDGEWSPGPPGLANALAITLPFVGEQGYTATVQLRNGKVGAISDKRGVMVPVEGLTVDRPMALSKEVAGFIAAQGDPDWLYQEDKALMARWEDGRWMRAQLWAYDVPDDRVDAIFDAAGEEAASVIDAPWREAYEDAVGLSSTGFICLTPDAFHFQNDITTGMVKHTTAGLEPDHRSYWDSKVLEPVVACAERWNPNVAKPTVFFGASGIKGVVMARSRW